MSKYFKILLVVIITIFMLPTNIICAGTVSNAHNIAIGEYEHGTVTSEKSTACEGDEVVLNVTHDTGFVTKFVAVYKTDEPWTYIDVVDNKFTMPDCNVTVEAIFGDPFVDLSDYYMAYTDQFDIAEKDILNYVKARFGEYPNGINKLFVGYCIGETYKYIYYNNGYWYHYKNASDNDYNTALGWAQLYHDVDNSGLAYLVGVDVLPYESDYVFKTPDNLTYDGNAKEVEFILKPYIVDFYRTMHIRYFNGEEELASAPKNEGDYTIKLDIVFDEGDSANEKTLTLTNDNWKFSIEAMDAPYTLTAPTTTEWVYDGSNHGDAAICDYNDVTITYQTKTNQTDEYGTASSTIPKIKDVGTIYVKATAKKDNYKAVSVEYKLEVTKRPVTISTDSACKYYDGTPLTCNKYTIGGDGFAASEGFNISITGTITDTGTVNNAFTYTAISGTKLSNYEVTESPGKLLINPAIEESETDFEIEGETLVKSFVKGEGTDCRFGIDENISILGEKVDDKYANVEVLIDDVPLVQGRDYIVTSGSIVLTFNDDYINTLTVGRHNHEIVIHTSATDSFIYEFDIIIKPKASVSNSYAFVKTSVE